jgi:hypothetical protein
MRGYSLLNSEFNDFLFAPIGEERNEMPLSVLSALTRLGIDPWQEAARLTQLPKEPATRSLASMIEALPGGRWAASDSGTIAARLVQLLPSRNNAKAPSNAQAPSIATNSSLRQMIRSLAIMWLIYAVMWGAVLMIPANRALPSAMNHTGTHLNNAVSPPQVPLRGINAVSPPQVPLRGAD